MRNLFQFLFGQAPQENGLEGTVVVPKIKQSVSLQIIMMMEQYIQENSSRASVPVAYDDYANLIKEHTRLSDIGLGNTKNAKIIEQRIQSFDADRRVTEKAAEVIQFIKKLRKHFGDSTVLISTEQFEKLLQKYSLATGVISDYTGTIPEKNILEIERTSKKIPTFQYKLNNINAGKNFLWKFNEVIYSSSAKGDIDDYLESWLTKKRGLILADTAHASFENTVRLGNIQKCNPDIPSAVKNYEWSNLISFRGSLVDSRTLFIACPPSQLKEQSLKITHKAIDPIVFQYSEYGVVIHSIWGEEAEDKVFEEYKRVNQLLSL